MTLTEQNQESATVLVEKNMRLVSFVVSKFVRKGRLKDSDLYSVGCIGLVVAAKTYDPLKSKFSTWATRTITQHVISELRRKSSKPSAFISSLDQQEQEKALEDHRGHHFPAHLVEILTRSDESDTPAESENKRILVGFYLNDESFAEIGRKFGISREAVRKKAQRAIESIRAKNIELLKEHF